MNQHVKPGKSERTEHGLTLTEPLPLSGIPAVWRLAALVSTLVMGALAIIAALYLGRSILLPVVAGLIVGITLAPAVKFGSRLSIPQPVSALLVVLSVVAVIGLLITFFAAPLTEWIARAPEIGAAVKGKLRVFDYPIAVLHDIKNAIMPAAATGQTVSVEANPAEIVGAALAAITPAVGQFVVFFGTLVFFLATNASLRQKLVVVFVTRDARLRMLRIWNDIEQNLVGYVGVVTVINVALGVVTTVMLYLVGFPNPVTFGLLTLVLNYIPVYRPGDRRAGAVRRRRGGDALARLCGARARAVRRDRDRGGAFHHAEHRRAPPHHEPVPGVPRARLLDLAVGADRRVPGDAAADHVVRGSRPPAAARGRDDTGLIICSCDRKTPMELSAPQSRWRPDLEGGL